MAKTIRSTSYIPSSELSTPYGFRRNWVQSKWNLGLKVLFNTYMGLAYFLYKTLFWS